MSGPSDQTVNKIAFCSAVVAGVAYVGYTVVRRVFTKGKNKQDRKKDDALALYPGSRRVYLRRLSGSDASTSTEALLGTLEGDEKTARLVLRPLSVQERIRELNMRARHFAETILAVQVQQNSQDSRRGIKYTRSLQTSPTRSSTNGGFILSPIDITHLGSSRCSSIENISADSSLGYHSLPRNVGYKRLSKRSSKLQRNSESGDPNQEEHFYESEGERLLTERQEELKKRLKGFEEGTTKVLTPYEAKSLVALLYSYENELLERALVTIANSAAFTTNQEYLREAGCIPRLHVLIKHEDENVQLAALSAVSNLALNTTNQKEMGDVVPTLLPLICEDPSPRFLNNHAHLIYQILLTLTNITALTDWHSQFRESLTSLLKMILSANSKIRLQVLRLMVNLSTNDEMVPYLLSAKAPDYLWNMLNENRPDDELLRVVSFLANLISAEYRLKSRRTQDDPDSLYSHIYGPENRSYVLEHLDHLMKNHQSEDIRMKARLIYNFIIASPIESTEES